MIEKKMCWRMKQFYKRGMSVENGRCRYSQEEYIAMRI